MDSMDTEVEDRCPVCLDSRDDPAYVMPCLHQFCYGCILRWVESKPDCPICRRTVSTIGHAVQGDDDFEEVVVRPAQWPSASSGTGQAGGASLHPPTHSPPRPATPQPLAVESLSGALVGGLQPDTWEYLFDDHPALLQHLLPWLRQQLQLFFAEQPSMADVMEDLILSVLRCFGLDVGMLRRLLEITLQHRAVTFLQQLINVVMQLCSRDNHSLPALGDSHAGDEQEDTPAAAPSPAAAPHRETPVPGPAPSSITAGDEADEDSSSSTAELRGVTSSPSNAPVHSHGQLHDEDLHGDLQQAVAGASTASRGSTRSPARPRRAPKRKAAGTQASAQPPKRPRRRHN